LLEISYSVTELQLEKNIFFKHKTYSWRIFEEICSRSWQKKDTCHRNHLYYIDCI